MSDRESLGKIAYEAYCTVPVPWAPDLEKPAWEELTQVAQDSWEAAADAVHEALGAKSCGCI